MANVCQMSALAYATERAKRERAPMTVWTDHSTPDAWGRSHYFVRSESEGKPTPAAVKGATIGADGNMIQEGK